MFQRLIALHQLLCKILWVFPHCLAALLKNCVWTWHSLGHNYTSVTACCHTYPIFIFDVDVSSFLNKAFHSVVTAFACCNVQSSLLMEEKTNPFAILATAISRTEKYLTKLQLVVENITKNFWAWRQIDSKYRNDEWCICTCSCAWKWWYLNQKVMRTM